MTDPGPAQVRWPWPFDVVWKHLSSRWARLVPCRDLLQSIAFAQSWRPRRSCRYRARGRDGSDHAAGGFQFVCAAGHDAPRNHLGRTPRVSNVPADYCSAVPRLCVSRIGRLPAAAHALKSDVARVPLVRIYWNIFNTYWLRRRHVTHKSHEFSWRATLRLLAS